MDTELARTFLTVVATGNFVSAAERLHVTQSTVSARIHALEEQLGCTLFVRNKAGTTLTPAGRQFQKHASTLVRTVEQARHDVGVPRGFRAALTIGTAWELADLPTFEVTEANKHRVVVLPPLRDVAEATKLLTRYLDAARKTGTDHAAGDLHPFTADAVAALFDRSNRKPRDILRKAHGLIDAAAADNAHDIDEAAVAAYLDAIGPDTESDIGPIGAVGGTSAGIDWSVG